MWKGLTTATQQGHKCRQRCHAPADANTGLSAVPYYLSTLTGWQLCKPEYVRRIAPLPNGFEADHLQLRRCCHAQRIRQLFAAARKAVGDVVVD